nr:MAG TPA: hypothetical protein [Caudoviricetes sp.]
MFHVKHVSRVSRETLLPPTDYPVGGSNVL